MISIVLVDVHKIYIMRQITNISTYHVYRVYLVYALVMLQPFNHSTPKALNIFYKNLAGQRIFFQYEIIINVSVSSFDSFEYLCYGSTTV